MANKSLQRTPRLSAERRRTRTLAVMQFAALFLAALLLVASAAVAAPDQHIDRAIGTYARQSRVCGGPGSADAKPSCTLVFDDSLDIRKPMSVQPESDATFEVSFIVHYGYMDYCRFEGNGIWSAGKVLLTSTNDSTTNPSCRLSLKISGNRVQVVDPNHSCARSMCVTPTGRVSGVTYRRQK